MKAQMRTLEAFLAGTILLLTITFLLTIRPRFPEFQSLDLKFRTLKVLESLDKNDSLRKFVYSNNSAELERIIESYLPKIYEAEVLICREGETCFLSLEAKEIYSVIYYLATNSTKFENRKVLVYIYQI